ncbi:MAG TPA: cytochrome c3 family protein, partial [Thermoleophilia bacterium]|nr:cytochrome c3 family protein [Thermoleophilia bacterium]
MRKRIAWIALSGLVLLAFVTVLGFRETSKPSFCSSCHMIEPYKASWDTSTHAAVGVGCVDCHFEPGAVGYTKGKLYSFIKLTQFAAGSTEKKPEAGKLVLGAACIQCHDYVRNPDDPRYPTGIIVEGITFPHQFHVDEANLLCSDCHSGIVHGSALVGAEKPQAAADPSFCNTCHTGDFAPILFTAIESAGREHPGAPKIDVNVWRNIHWRVAGAPAVVDGVQYDKIEKDTCLACHQEPTVAKACKSCHAARVPEFSASPQAARASMIPVVLFAFLFALFMVSVFLRRHEKERFFSSVVLRIVAVAVVLSDAFVVYLIVNDVLREQTGHHEVGPTTVWVSYLLLSVALVAFLLFEAGLLPSPLHKVGLPREDEDEFLVPKPIRRMKARTSGSPSSSEGSPSEGPSGGDASSADRAAAH